MERMDAVLLLVLVMLAGSQCEDVFDIEDLGLLPSTRAGENPVGTLECDSTEIRYKLQDFRIMQEAFLDVSLAKGATVESVQLGPDKNAAECIAQRFPSKNCAAEQGSNIVVAKYSQCNFTAVQVTDVSNHTTVTYSTTATITVKYPSPAPGISRRKRFQLGLSCTGPLNAVAGSHSKFVDIVKLLEDVPGEFGQSLSARTIQKIRSSFGNTGETNVHTIIIELEEPAPEAYEILGRRCWATPDANGSNHIRYEFLSPQGCDKLGAEFLEVRSTGSHKISYNVAEFEFDELETTENIFFHCEINICLKGKNDPRCQSSGCQDSAGTRLSGSRTGVTGKPNYQISSAPEKRHPTIRPHIKVDKNGKATSTVVSRNQ